MEMKVSPVVPADCQQFIHILRDDQSDFCFPLGTSLAGGADAWCVTYKFDKQTILPGSRLPEDGIVPFLLEAKPKKQIPIQLAAIPGKYYRRDQVRKQTLIPYFPPVQHHAVWALFVSWSSIPYHPDQKISLDIIGRDMKMPREMPDSLIHGPIPSI